MSNIVYRIVRLLSDVVSDVPIGTNLGLFSLIFALLSGRFLDSRGAVFPALADLGLCAAAVRRAEAALASGRWSIADLVSAWNKIVRKERRFQAHRYGGFCPVACDLIGFFRPRLAGNPGKHYTSQAGKALPAIVVGVCASVGSVGKTRLPFPRLILREQASDCGEAGLQRRLIEQAASDLASDEVIIVDAGFSLKHLLGLEGTRFVVRARTNFTARRNTLPLYKGRGARPKVGELVRPLARSYRKKSLPATSADRTLCWSHEGRRIEADVYDKLVQKEGKPGDACFVCVVIRDPRYKEPLVLASNVEANAYLLWQLYRDRWPIEQMPLAAKQMLGAERSFVFGKESRYRLPELALLAGSILSYAAATGQPMASGFWDRCARPTCGRLRRALHRVIFADLSLPDGKLRKKESVTSHLATGVRGHRRQKAVLEPPQGRRRAV